MACVKGLSITTLYKCTYAVGGACGRFRSVVCCLHWSTRPEPSGGSRGGRGPSKCTLIKKKAGSSVWRRITVVEPTWPAPGDAGTDTWALNTSALVSFAIDTAPSAIARLETAPVASAGSVTALGAIFA